MLVGGFGVLVGKLAMFVSRHSVLLRIVMLTHVVMMCRLKVVMGRYGMMSGSSVMMLAGWVFLFRHVVVLLNNPFRHGTKCPFWTRYGLLVWGTVYHAGENAGGHLTKT
jgi:hypothetical protein